MGKMTQMIDTKPKAMFAVAHHGMARGLPMVDTIPSENSAAERVWTRRRKVWR